MFQQTRGRGGAEEEVNSAQQQREGLTEEEELDLDLERVGVSRRSSAF